jgi:hypothetical protein
MEQKQFSTELNTVMVTIKVISDKIVATQKANGPNELEINSKRFNEIAALVSSIASKDLTIQQQASLRMLFPSNFDPSPGQPEIVSGSELDLFLAILKELQEGKLENRETFVRICECHMHKIPNTIYMSCMDEINNQLTKIFLDHYPNEVA